MNIASFLLQTNSRKQIETINEIKNDLIKKNGNKIIL